MKETVRKQRQKKSNKRIKERNLAEHVFTGKGNVWDAKILGEVRRHGGKHINASKIHGEENGIVSRGRVTQTVDEIVDPTAAEVGFRTGNVPGKVTVNERCLTAQEGVADGIPLGRRDAMERLESINTDAIKIQQKECK